ncbi:MAG: hypothetical protein ACT4QD_07865 [Acidobacteriota bacterium]
MARRGHTALTGRWALGRVVAASVAAVALSATAASPAFAQAKPNTQKRNKQEQVEIEQLVKMVDGVMAGQPAPADIQIAITPFFLKSQEQRTFVPFTLQVTGAPAVNSAMYVRVVDPAAEPDPKTKKVVYPWDDIHFVPSAQLSGADVRLNRVFMAVPGKYDVYIALKERLPEKAPRGAVAKAGLLKAQVVVPDFWNGEMSTSSVIVTSKVNMLTAAPSPEEMRERPFIFGAQELIPALDPVFAKSEQLATFFQVYNATLDAAGKPNLVMEYNFHRKEAGAEKFFNKTNPQMIDATSLPPTFDPAKFPVPGGIEVPLTSFPEGDYRLEIKVTDKNSGKTLTRDVNFTVKAS